MGSPCAPGVGFDVTVAEDLRQGAVSTTGECFPPQQPYPPNCDHPVTGPAQCASWTVYFRRADLGATCTVTLTMPDGRTFTRKTTVEENPWTTCNYAPAVHFR